MPASNQVTTPPIFFVSYARADAEHEPDRKLLLQFVRDLGARVATAMPTPREGVFFFDESSIETGEVWTNALADALMTSRVGVALYSPNYFASRWCTKEFHAFVQRARPGGGPSGIIPVLWNKCASKPQVTELYQYSHGAFPVEYTQVGMVGLMRLSAYADKYQLALDGLERSIVDAARASPLQPLGQLDLDALTSDWERATPHSRTHTRGNVSKTCFVFVARSGWDWNPYPQKAQTIGALAQRVSGDLGLRYEEIPCDGTLCQKLEETKRSNVPTILFADPGSLSDPAYADPMKGYDDQYLLNCAALVPWDRSAEPADTHPHWLNLRAVLPQKTDSPPPHHDWCSIFTSEDLETKTKTTIEHIRSRLMKQLVSGSAATTGSSSTAAAVVRRAENRGLTESAAAIGISTETPAIIEGPSR